MVNVLATTLIDSMEFKFTPDIRYTPPTVYLFNAISNSRVQRSIFNVSNVRDIGLTIELGSLELSEVQFIMAHCIFGVPTGHDIRAGGPPAFNNYLVIYDNVTEMQYNP